MDVVVFMGKLPHEQVKQELEKADIYLQYSIQEGFCNSVLDAQAMGLLCVVSDAEGLSENVLHEQTGWVVPKRQPKLLALKLVEIITLTKEKQETISKQAQAHVKQYFTLQQQQASFKLFYAP
jgi:colanic acid/amylovoran biosynthesis glycosyltransferase